MILNNGIEFGVTYLVMLLSLLFTGGGRFTSIDYYLSRLFPARADSRELTMAGMAYPT